MNHVNLLAKDAELSYFPGFIPAAEASRLLQHLTRQLAWRQDSIQLFGQQRMIPRLQCFQGDAGLAYRYSRLTLMAEPWDPSVEQLRNRLMDLGHDFNCVLINLYRDGNDSMGWHSDDEPELGTNPVIASLSLGQTRQFKMRHKQTGEKLDITLEHGSLLLMSGPTQHHWQHAIMRSKRPMSERINLTFRSIPA
ncbi:alpha-ketoglutarate-dependent dioxygenase AlkB family protein [Nitrincola alkalilacustris]|uniref:alpha-ketoglutarate-dependent dioxygenase AlkB family protein n=1 Tax=Nitrincola alkalilacustris TaxID=1571224 RepID=UPI00124D1310|nr:alpha-ketoglutarate-dependent dioxygenase AlkB [Nitrincola alkalilacustris]